MVPVYRSHSPVSRCPRLVSWRRICPDESECRFFAPEVFPPRRSRCRALYPSRHQTRKVLQTQNRLILACPLHCYLCKLWFHMAPPEGADTQLWTLWYHRQAPYNLSPPVDLHSSMRSWTSRNSDIRLGSGCLWQW